MNSKKFETVVGGRSLSVEFTDIAMHAHGSAFVRYGDTVVFATAVMTPDPKDALGYFPLTVDYEEKFYAAGAILGSRFIRREARPSEEAILVGRLIDRTIRPLFNKKIRNAVHIVVTALSVDGENDPDVPAVLAASLALATSDIPWDGPVSALRIGGDETSFIINPTYEEREKGKLDLVVSGKGGKINMIESGAEEISEERMVDAFLYALPVMEQVETFQKNIIREIGLPKRVIPIQEEPEEMVGMFRKHLEKRLEDAIYTQDKGIRQHRLSDLKKEWMDSALKEFPGMAQTADDVFEEAINDIVHRNILSGERRPDGRRVDQLRDIYAEVAILPRTHGSGLFYRGETHILSVVTLGAPGDVQLVEGMEIRTKKRFMHHYNFPPFSTGEVGRIGSPGRREIGHGALVERALRPVIPSKEEFPYTIRVVSEALSSNGSTSMGSVCASILALMDAGVPIKKPVAGIAMGLIMKNEKEYKVLTDLQGPEDHHGDMDFKAAGTKDGLTAIQMDVKVEGVTVEILRNALRDAKKARLEIMQYMHNAIPEPRSDLSMYAPRIIVYLVPVDKIKDVIGPGGKVINKIIDETGVTIDIEDDGHVYITSPSKEMAEKALEIIKQITKEFKVGETFMGRVSRIFNFGAMVEIAPKQEGLVHISELAPWRVNKVTDVINIGDIIPVKIISIDEQGRVNLSYKAMNGVNGGKVARDNDNAAGNNNSQHHRNKRNRYKDRDSDKDDKK